MKFLSIILICLTSIFLTGCTKLEQNSGLLFIPIVLLLAALICLYNAWKGYNSGSKQQTKDGIVSSNKKTVPIGMLVWGIALFLASWGSYALIVSENRAYDPKKDGPMPTAPAPDNRESAEDQEAKADSVYNLKK